MQFIWNDLIHRAKVYKDEDHASEGDWILPADWLTLFQVEYALLYPRWLRSGLVSPAPTDAAFTGSTTTIAGVCAILGVAEDLGDGFYRPVEDAGRFPHGNFYSSVEGKSFVWTATGAADDITVTLHPPDSTGNYVVRYITRPAYATDPTSTVDIPYGADERLVLGVADRAGIKDSSTSRKISELKADADAALQFMAASRGAPRVRRVTRFTRNDRFAAPWPTDPTLWRYV